MGRQLSLLLFMVMLLAPVMPLPAQQPVNPVPQPGIAQAPPTPEMPLRNPNFEYVLAFGGTGLLLLIVCYPSRRY